MKNASVPQQSDASGPQNAPSLTREHIDALMRQHGYRLTAPRAIVVEAMLTYDRPFSAEQLVTDLRQRATSRPIGRATVYRTLEILASIDVLTRIIGPEGHPAYICDSLGHRHHLVCSGCGAAVAFTSCPVDELVAKLSSQTDFVINDHLLEVFGVCPTCQDDGPSRLTA